MKNVCYLVILFLFVVGIIGGIGYTIYYGGYPIAVGIAIAAWFGYPKAVEMFNKMMGK